MAVTNYGVNNNLAVKLFARKLFEESLKECELYKMMGEDASSAIQILKDFEKSAGDQVTYGLRMLLTGAGKQGDDTLEGNEEALVTYSDALLINQLRHAVRSAGKMSEQRVPFSVREEARQGLTDWFADRIDTSLFNQLGGNTGQADTRYTGNNATVAPTASTNWVFANGVANETQVASASASNVFKLSMIDALVEKAKTNTPKIRPLKVNGKDKYVMFLHPYQVTDLRQNTSTGQWLDITKAVYQQSKENNPIYQGGLGEYNGVVLHESVRVPAGLVSGVYRAIFIGAQAAVVGFGMKTNKNKPNWFEELFDYGNQLGVAASMIWGAKKTQFNNTDFGTIVLSTYAAAH